MSWMFLIPSWGWLLLSSVFFAAGEYVSKIFALQPGWMQAAGSVGLYACATLLWLPAILQTNQLAITGALWGVLSLLMTALMGMVVFGESVSGMQFFGIVLALAAVGFLSLG